MNRYEDVLRNTLKDGVETPFGTIYVVASSDPKNFPGLSLYIKREEEERAIQILTIEATQIEDCELRALVYPKVFDFDDEPKRITFDFSQVEEDE